MLKINENNIMIKNNKCKYSNENLNNENWNKINERCKKKDIIDFDENVEDIIKNDEMKLKNLGITFSQLRNFLKKIKYHYINQCKLVELPNGNIESIKLTKKEMLLIQSKTGLQSDEYFTLRIFNNKLTVVLHTSFLDEKCPFDNDKTSRGAKNWFFINSRTNKFFHIRDILFHQIIHHNFMNGPSSSYRIDPIEFVSFFSLKRDVDYSTDTIIEYEWIYCEDSLVYFPDENQKKEKYIFGDEELYFFEGEETIEKNIGKNDIYHTDKKLVLIINDISTLEFPIIVNGSKVIFNSDETESEIFGSIFFVLKKQTKITENEKNHMWI